MEETPKETEKESTVSLLGSSSDSFFDSPHGTIPSQ